MDHSMVIKSMFMITLFSVSLGGITFASNCKSDCATSDTYFKDNCMDSLDLEEECSENNECSTAFARCLDGKCSCVGGFKPRTVSPGFPMMCVPENPMTEADELIEANGDICRIDRSTLVPPDLSIKPNPDYLALVFPGGVPRTVRRQRRFKRQMRLPPTLVNNCRGNQACFQLIPSAYGVCSKPQCPLGEPVSAKTAAPCQVGNPDTCPSGYECHQSNGQKRDINGNTYQATICCPRICEGKGTYLDGKCYKDRKCMDSLLKCTLRCEHEPCRFMVNPCENYGQCLVPNRRGSSRPKYFWCHCTDGYSGNVCQNPGDNIDNGPSKDRQIKCMGTFCDPPPAEKVVVTVMKPFPFTPSRMYQQQAQRMYQPPPQPKLVAPALPPQPKQSLNCRRNRRADCEALAATGHCHSSKQFMVNNCDCACSRTILQGIFGARSFNARFH